MEMMIQECKVVFTRDSTSEHMQEEARAFATNKNSSSLSDLNEEHFIQHVPLQNARDKTRSEMAEQSNKRSRLPFTILARCRLTEILILLKESGECIPDPFLSSPP